MCAQRLHLCSNVNFFLFYIKYSKQHLSDLKLYSPIFHNEILNGDSLKKILETNPYILSRCERPGLNTNYASMHIFLF